MNSRVLENRISGSPRVRFVLELFSNTAVFPLANIVFELLIEGGAYLSAPDVYILLGAAFVQAYYLSRWANRPGAHRLLGNLIAPALYTVIESVLEGPGFFAAPHHVAYWGFALVIGLLQALMPYLPPALAALALLLENLTRASLLFGMYALFEIQTNPTQTVSLLVFFSDASHQFILAATLLLGLGTGLANLVARSRLLLLQQTSAQLQRYSEWLLGRDLLNRIVANPQALALTRQERTILFMDIRGFTQWSDSQPPETVAALLNTYYHLAEVVFASHLPLKFKFTADEVMAVFVNPASALAAAVQLRTQVNALLAAHNLGVGIGLHTGAVAEGLLGSSGVKFYDVLGDTVNVAKRIEGSARRNEILVSEQVRLVLTPQAGLSEQRELLVKGKTEPLVVYLLENPKGAEAGAQPARPG